MSMEAELAAGVGFGVGGLVALAGTPAAIRLAALANFYDHPRQYRQHAAPTPFLGGLAVLTAFLVAALVVAGTSWTQVQVFDIENTTSTVSTNWAAAVSGTTAITLTPSCPQGAPATNATYEATGSALQLIYSTGGFTVSETFAKQ